MGVKERRAMLDEQAPDVCPLRISRRALPTTCFSSALFFRFRLVFVLVSPRSSPPGWPPDCDLLLRPRSGPSPKLSLSFLRSSACSQVGRWPRERGSPPWPSRSHSRPRCCRTSSRFVLSVVFCDCLHVGDVNGADGDADADCFTCQDLEGKVRSRKSEEVRRRLRSASRALVDSRRYRQRYSSATRSGCQWSMGFCLPHHHHHIIIHIGKYFIQPRR